ncbi:MAG: outer membrane protein assembly factor BamD [Rickettsiales bacterium]|jgi:outer membrane protein assembly factor BamD|nr:outer membrane protein assembly factor BamD [Rickettsiales bacterium]
MIKKQIIIVMALFALTACSGTDAPELSDTEIYTEAHEKLANKDFSTAAARFEDVDKLHPASPWIADSLVLAAYSYYMDGDFASAILSADRFLRFHPGNPNAAYMMYLRGMAFMEQASDVQRDASMTQDAIAAFGALIERFPKSEYAENAKNKVSILRNYLAGKLMFLARQEMRRQNWTAAITRLNGLILSLQDTKMVPEALYRLAVCYAALGMGDQVRAQQEVLRTNFPDSEWLDLTLGLSV